MTGSLAPRTVLVLNSGSSSLKYSLVSPSTGDSIIDGIVERIGEDDGVADHEAALRVAFEAVADAGHDVDRLVAVGHRVVHGGSQFYRPTVIDDEVLWQLRELSPLAPLHNPPAILGIEVARRVLPNLPHIAVFDTAFFHDLPAAAARYAIDVDIAREWGIRRFGFHGTSHHFVSRQAAAFLGADVSSLNQIVLHLGNGASASAIRGGRPVDTSMGMTPMEGLVMGTRSGDVDPGVIFYLARTAAMQVGDIETMLNRRSGMLGMSGEIDFRTVHRQIADGDEAAGSAYEIYIHRLRKYIGAYLAVLGHVDAITFTAGVGENDAAVRRDATAGLRELGIELDERRNTDPARGARRISADDSRIAVLVIPTDEELAIARACLQAI